MNSNQSASVMIREYWSLVVRRKWIIISSVLTCSMVALVLCLVLPKTYRSSTLILIEDQKIPDEYVKGIGGASVDERITMIQQQVMSRTLLSQIVDEFKLYNRQVEGEGVESAIEGMRKAIKVETVGTVGNRGKSVEAINISFSHDDPMTAMKVASKLAALFIEQNLKVREQLITGVSVFLEQELHDAKKALELQEQAISEFKTKHMGVLPQQMEANLRALDRLQADLTSTDELLHDKSNALSAVEKSIKEYEVTGTTQAIGGAPANHGRMDPLVARLRELERSLTTLLAEYKETYPDIVQIRQELAGVQRQLAAKYGDPSAEKDADAARTFDPYLRELIKQRNELRVEVLSLKDRSRKLTEHIRAFEHRVEQTPSREQDLMILMRDYDNMQKNYQALLDKRLNAHVAENLEKRQKGEQFRVLDPANVPQNPDKPNRMLILFGGLAAGCGLGFGGAFIIETLNPAFRRTEDAEHILGLPILAGIPSFDLLLGARRSLSVSSALPHSPTSNEVAKTLPSFCSFGRGKDEIEESLPALAGLFAQGGGVAAQSSWNLVSKWWPGSMITEQYRVAASRLALMSSGRGRSVLLVTSSVSAEGKSTTSINLGYVFAQGFEKDTLLIECDLKRPAACKYLAIPPGPGLSDYWAGTHTLDACIHKMADIPLWVLPAGTRALKTELSKIRQLEQLLDEVRGKFDHIILDAPPIFPLADLHVLSRMADVLVFVIRAGRTSCNVVESALKALDPQCQIGVILAGVESNSIPDYFYHYDDEASARSLRES